MKNYLIISLLMILIIGCAPVATTKKTQKNENQPSKSSTDHQEEDQQPSLYQFLGSMSPEEHMKFKAFMHNNKKQNAILSNVGSERMEYYKKEVAAGRLTWSQAHELSLKDLPALLRELDNLYFARDNNGNLTTSTKDMLKWYDKNKLKPEFGERESIRFNTLYSKVKVRENETINNRGQSESKEKSNADNITSELKIFKNMLDAGLISQEDYDAKKKELLGF